MTRQCLLIRCETTDMATGADLPVHLSAGAGMHTYDGERWTDAILDPQLLRIDYQAFPYANGLGGRSLPAVGALLLKNDRHAQDLLVRHAWDGRPMTVWRGPVGAAFSEFQPVITGVTDQPTFDSGRITVPIRDAAVLFDRPALQTTYTGGGGYEGLTHLAGTKKPRLIGFAHQFEPVLLDPSIYLYQVADGGISNQFFRVDERAKAFPVDAVSDVLAWTANPVPGRVAVSYVDGVFALGAPPQGVITCSAGLGTFDRHGSAVVYLLQQLLDFSFQPPLDLAALTALNAALPGQMGLYLRDGNTTVAAVLDQIATSAGAWWGLTPDGTFTMRQWAWREPVATLREDRDFRDAIVAEPVELPVSRLILQYGRRVRTLSEQELGDVVLAGNPFDNARARANAMKEWRAKHYNTTDVTKRRLARELTLDSLYADTDGGFAVIPAVQAQGRLLAADRWRLRVALRGRTNAFLCGDTVALQTPRFGFAGSEWLVNGISTELQPDPENDRTTLRLWGPRGSGVVGE